MRRIRGSATLLESEPLAGTSWRHGRPSIRSDAAVRLLVSSSVVDVPAVIGFVRPVDPGSGQRALGSFASLPRGDPPARAGARPSRRLSRQRRPMRRRGPALLSPRGLVGVEPDSAGTRTLLRRHRGVALCRSGHVRARADVARGAAYARCRASPLAPPAAICWRAFAGCRTGSGFESETVRRIGHERCLHSRAARDDRADRGRVLSRPNGSRPPVVHAREPAPAEASAPAPPASSRAAATPRPAPAIVPRASSTDGRGPGRDRAGRARKLKPARRASLVSFVTRLVAWFPA